MFRIALAITMAVFGGKLTALAQASDLGTIKIRAEANDKLAQDKLAESYLVTFYFVDAVKWFQAAAKQGVVNSQWRLGQIYLNGKSGFPKRSAAIPADLSQGLYWLKRAAAAEHPDAQRDLGLCYESGKGVTKDYAEAYKWFTLSAKRGSIMARSHRDSLALKMKAAEIHEAEHRAASFVPGIMPSVWGEIQLKGISGSPNRRLAIINNTTVETGEKFTLKVGGEAVSITCEKITDKSAILSVGNEVRELIL